MRFLRSIIGMNIVRLLTVTVLVPILGACEGVARRTIEIENTTMITVSAVSKAVVEFAVKQGFTCREQTGAVILECRAAGPRFLSVEAKPNSSLVELAQPFPLSSGGAPTQYQATSDELTTYMNGRFGNSARVLK
jgi:hypothetical protein